MFLFQNLSTLKIINNRNSVGILILKKSSAINVTEHEQLKSNNFVFSATSVRGCLMNVIEIKVV